MSVVRVVDVVVVHDREMAAGSAVLVRVSVVDVIFIHMVTHATVASSRQGVKRRV